MSRDGAKTGGVGARGLPTGQRRKYAGYKRPTKLIPSEIEKQVKHYRFEREMTVGQTAAALGISESSIKRYQRVVAQKLADGAYELAEPEDTRTDYPHYIIWKNLTQEARDMLENVPEGFERFFNKFAWESDPKMVGVLAVLQDHSRTFVEAAYHRCEKHPRLDGTHGIRLGDVWHPAVLARSASSAACKECGWKKRVLINCPPDHAKSAIFTVWMSVWRIAQDRNHKRVLISATEAMSKTFLREIADILETNEALMLTYGMFSDDSPEVIWNKSSGIIRVSGSTFRRGVNLLSRGMDSQITSLRADELVIDDAVDPNTVSSKEKREKDSNTFHNVILTRGASGRIWFIGTVWHPQDLSLELAGKRRTNVFMEATGEEEPVWERILFPAVLDWATKETLWPNVWPFETLQRDVIDAIGSPAFELVYQQNPLGDDETLCKYVWMYGAEGDRDERAGCLDRGRVRGWPEAPDHGWLRVASFDPSPSKWAGFVIADVCIEDRTLFRCNVIFVDRWKGNIREATEHFAAYLPAFGVRNLIIERNLGHEYLRSTELNNLLKNLSVRLRDHFTPAYSRLDKQGTGAWALASDFEFGRIRLPYADPESRAMAQLLITEATTFPHGSTSDVLMALSFIKAEMPALRPMQYAPSTTETFAHRQLHRRSPGRWVRDREVVPA